MNLEMCESTTDRVYLITLTTNAQIAKVIHAVIEWTTL